MCFIFGQKRLFFREKLIVQRYFKQVLVALFVLCSFFIQLRAQKIVDADKPAGDDEKNAPAAVEIDWQLTRGAKEFGFETGFAPTQPIFFSGRKEYDTNGRKFLTLSFRIGRVVGTKKGVTYEYFVEAIPVAVAFKNEVKNPAYDSETETPGEPPTVRETTYGVGIKPANFRFIFRAHRRLKPFAQTGAGFIFTKKPIPVPQSPNYNFIGDFGGGLMYSLRKKQTVSLGYKYFHISNMNIGEINPGYNANIFYIGYSFFSK